MPRLLSEEHKNGPVQLIKQDGIMTWDGYDSGGFWSTSHDAGLTQGSNVLEQYDQEPCREYFYLRNGPIEHGDPLRVMFTIVSAIKDSMRVKKIALCGFPDVQRAFDTSYETLEEATAAFALEVPTANWIGFMPKSRCHFEPYGISHHRAGEGVPSRGNSVPFTLDSGGE